MNLPQHDSRPLRKALNHQRPGSRGKPRIVPPRPSKAERMPVPYSKASLDSLLATCEALQPVCLVTIKPPPCGRLVTWTALREALRWLKLLLVNWKKRYGFPTCVGVVEFDPYPVNGVVLEAASFHIGFAQCLTANQIEKFEEVVLRKLGEINNSGRVFDYEARGGGPELASYLAKQINFRGGQCRPTKWRPSWMPMKIECSLWFASGIKRSPSSTGRKRRRERGTIRRSFDHTSKLSDNGEG